MNNLPVFLPRWLVIGGSGRNIGKTTLSSSLISRFSREFPIIALKFTTHLHDPGIEKFSIQLETHPPRAKDTYRMLHSGAIQTWYVQTKPACFNEAFLELLGRIPEGQAVICESNSLARFMRPGLFLFIRPTPDSEIKESVRDLFPLADIVLHHSGNTGFDWKNRDLYFDSEGWRIRGQ